MTNYGYNQPNYINPYGRANYNLNNYVQPQYAAQPQQMMQQQVAQQPQQQMQYEMPMFVNNGTIKEAEAYILFPNQKAIFIDKANGMIYEKICGQDGQSFITHFKRIENKGENQAVEPTKDKSTIDLSNYVERKELGAFVSLNQYNELKDMFEKLQKQIMGVRQNVGTTKQQ